MAREIKPDADILGAVTFIRDYALTPEQIAYRYTVKQIDAMCAELGLAPIEGELEEAKALRLFCAARQPLTFNVLS